MSANSLDQLFGRLGQPETATPPGEAADAPPAAGAQSTSAEKMGERFVRAGLLTQEQVQRIVALQQAERLRFGQAAVRLGFVSEEMVQRVLAEQYNYAADPGGQAAGIALPIASAPFGQEAEAIRRIRAEITIRLEGEPRIALAIVSPGEGEGKSYLAASLAVAFAQTGRRTLLVNADLRAGGQRGLLGDGAGAGLSGALAGRAPAGAGRPVPGFPTLAVLDAGPQPPNPAELLRKPALERLLADYAGAYDVFVIDTPAAGRSADAQTIARQADACLLVARKDRTRLADLQQTVQMLESSGTRILGTVYNEHPLQSASTGAGGGPAWLRRLLSALRR